jgi:hypothetical protein
VRQDRPAPARGGSTPARTHTEVNSTSVTDGGFQSFAVPAAGRIETRGRAD